jgi:hypothetical protein
MEILMRASYAPLFAGPMLALMLAAAPAMAQTTTSAVPPPNVPAPATAPDGQPAQPDATVATTNAPKGEQGPGIDSANAVNPAPGSGEHPYVGHSENAFYNVEQRIGRVEQRAAALTGAKKRKAMSGLKSIKAELATQEARHGEVRDWDREHLNKRLDALEASVGIGGQAGATASRGE